MSTVLPERPLESSRKRSAWEIQRAVLFALVLREMKARVGGQWIGAVWTLIEPLTHVLILVTIIGIVRGAVAPSYEYPVFLVTGLLPYFLFQNLAMRLMDGIESNRGLFSYRQVKPLDTLLSRTCVESLMNLLVYAFTLGILALLGYHVVPVSPLEMIGATALMILLGSGFGILCAVGTYERPRLRSFVRMLMMPLYFASGVVFQVDVLPREYLDMLLLNPLLHLVELSRHAFISAYTPAQGVNALYPLVWMLSIGAFAMLLYRANRLRLAVSN